MISETTQEQIEDLRFASRPLVICDVDEVVVHFTRDFESYLGLHGLWLDPAGFALNGNVRRKADHSPVPNGLVADLIGQFFADRTRHLVPIDGAVEALQAIGALADVVMLTNLPHSSGTDRRANLESHGLSFPVVTNSGPKGPAIAELVRRARAPAVFVDDSPAFIASAYEHAPDVRLVHFLHDARFARHLTPFDYVSLHTGSWQEARPHIIGLVGREG